MTRGDKRQHWLEQMEQAATALLISMCAANLFGVASAMADDNRVLLGLSGVFGLLELIAGGRVVYCVIRYRRVGRDV